MILFAVFYQGTVTL